MTQSEIPKAYEPKGIEDSIYNKWEESGFFNPDNLPGSRKDSFTISMPPPNATGVLHLGHAAMLAIEDLVIRYQRMNGKAALWVPGTDHASIATQTKVEKILKKEHGKSRHDLGREAFLKKVEEFVADSQNTIKSQIRKMGSSCDWSRERYTLDDGLSNAVNHAFVQMYNDGLIYRGNRIVNWCSQCASTIADDEVEHKEQKGKFYYIKYGPFTVATTRPETKLGDTAAAVNPNDDRYKEYLGQEINVNLGKVDIKVRVIADQEVDPNFGTGVVGVTVAHSAIDFEMGQKNDLPIIEVIGKDGRMTKNARPYAGMEITECRQRFIADLETAGLIEKVEEIDNSLSVCYRCGTAIEPLPSLQWFVDVNKPLDKFKGKSIKERALEVVKGGDVEIIPERFNKIYFHWLENLKDWCVSRQIWFGHRIPVWYKGDEIYVGLEEPKGEGWQQDSDTLDTWFSSGLWTFSTLGWPDKTSDFKKFHPTALMETGYDILFFWVARMIIMSTYLVEEVPFKQVYLHGLIRDEKGRKMSKSLDNTIDPLDTIAQYGADATRLSLVIGTGPGNDLSLSEKKIAGYRNFVNKLWNISRYILMTVKKVEVVQKQPKPKTMADKWILSELNELIEFSTENLEKYNFSIVGERIYEFTWSKLADWYLEIAKVEKDKDEILLYILQSLLKLWHPFTPFVTEKIWERISDDLLIIQPWPKEVGKIDKKVLKEYELLKGVVTSVRNLRAESKIAPSQKLNAIIIAASNSDLISDQAEVIKSLARLQDLEVLSKGKKLAKSLSSVVEGIEIYLPVADIIDVDAEKSRLQKEAKRLEEFISHLDAKLKNDRFLERAPQNIIVSEKEKLETSKQNLEKINQQLNSL